MERSSGFIKDQLHGEELVCSNGDTVCRGSTHTRHISVHCGTAAGYTGSSSAVAASRFRERENNVDEELLSPDPVEASPAGGTSSTSYMMKGDEADRPDDVAKTFENSQRADGDPPRAIQGTDIPKESSSEESVKGRNAFNGCSPQQTTRVKASRAQAQPLDSLELLNGFDGAAANVGTTAEPELGSTCTDSCREPRRASFVAAERTPATCAVKRCEQPAAVAETAPVDSLYSYTASTSFGKDVLGDARSSQVSVLDCNSQQLISECKTHHEQQMLDEAQQPTNKNAAEIETEDTGESRKTHLLVEVPDVQSLQDTGYQRQLLNPDETGSKECGDTDSSSADNKANGRNEQSVSRHSLAALCRTGKGSLLAPQNTSLVAQVDSGEGVDRQQSCRKDVEALDGSDLTDLPSKHLQPPEHADSASASVSCRTVRKRNFFQKDAEDESGDISTRLPELRQFTLELLYAVSLLRPFGKKACSGRDVSDCLWWQAAPAVDQREGVPEISTTQLVSPSECSGVEHGKGQTTESPATGRKPPETARIDTVVSDHQQLPAVVPTRVHLRQSQGFSDVDYVAALKRHVTDAVMLCTGDGAPEDFPRMRVHWMKGEGGGGFEAKVGELCRGFASDGEDAAEAAVATVASAGVRPHRNSFEVLAEKISALKSTKELVVLLYGYFGPLLHLLEEHMSRNTLLRSDKSTADNRIKSAGVCSGDSGAFQLPAQAMEQRPNCGLYLQQHVLHGAHMDQTLKGVNAILQVLTETDQSAADKTLDSVCDRLFPSRYDEEEPESVCFRGISSGTSGYSELMGKTGKERKHGHTSQLQTGERSSVMYPLPHEVTNTGSVHSEFAVGQRSCSWVDPCKQKAERQFRFCDDEVEGVSGKNTRTSDCLSLSTVTEGALHLSGEKKPVDLKARNDARTVTEAGHPTHLADRGTTVSGNRACREGPASNNALGVSAAEDHDDTAQSVCAKTSLPVAVRRNHGIDKKGAAESFGGAYHTPDADNRDTVEVSQFPLQRQQHRQESLLPRTEMEERGCSVDRSVERDVSVSSRTAWLAAQLSTPLDFLGVDCLGDMDTANDEEVSEEVARILDSLEAALSQPSVTHLVGSSAASGVEKQVEESPGAPQEWETGVQLVLRMLREQEEQGSLSDAAETSIENRCLSMSERNPKRRAVLNENEAGETAHGRVLSEQQQLHGSVQATIREGYKELECIAGGSSHAVSSAADSSRGTIEGAAASERSRTLTPDQDVSTAAADQEAVPGKCAAAAAVERAAAAVAQQGVAAAVEQARAGSAELMRRIRDLGCVLPAEEPGSTLRLTTELASSSCHALRRAVKCVGPSTNDEDEEYQAQEESRRMFAELDSQGLDSLVSQLLKLAGRPTEQRRGQDIYGEKLLRLLGDTQREGHPECKQRQRFDLQQGCSSHQLRHQQPERHPQRPKQQAQWEETTAEGIAVRHGGSGDGAPGSRHSALHRETEAQSTSSVMLANMHVSSRARQSGDSHTTAVCSYLRSTEVSQREETVMPADVSPALDKRTGVSSIAAGPPRPLSFGSIRLDFVESMDNTSSSPAGSPYTSHCDRQLTETAPLSVTGSVGPSQRQSSMKRSPWRSCEPYSSSGSTVAASPVAASAQSFGSSSLASSPFSLLPTSAITAFQPTGAAPDSRSEDTGEASTSVGSGGSTLDRGARLGLIENLERESTRPVRDSFSPQNSSRGNEEGQRRRCLEAMLHPFGLLPARVSGADSFSTSSGTTGLRETSGARAHPGEDATGVEPEHRSDVADGSLYAHLKASDFFDISASARAHLLGQTASPPAPVIRAVSALAPVVPLILEGRGGSGRRQEQEVPGVGSVQADVGTKQAPAGCLEFLTTRGVRDSALPREKGHGGPKRASSRKCEAARLLPPYVSSMSGDRYLSDSRARTMSASGLQSFDFSKPAFREASTLNADAEELSAGEQPSNQRIRHQQLGNTESVTCAARVIGGAPTTMNTRVPADHEQQQFDAITSMGQGHSWAHAAAGSNGRTSRQQQRSSTDVKNFWLKGSGATHRGLLRARSTGGGRQEEKDGGRYSASSPVSPVFTRSTPPGIRREAATAGCVGAGGADCLCGGTLCFYRSAVSGVVYDKSGQKWTARWNEDGRQHKRTFAAAKYGFLTAKLKAETCRGEARERTARAKHEALQQQQEYLAQRGGLHRAAPSADDGVHCHRGAGASTSATDAARGMAEQKKMRQ